EERVDQLRHNGVVVADNAGEERLAGAELGNQVFAHFLVHVAPRHAAVGDGTTQIADRGNPCGSGHGWILSNAQCGMHSAQCSIRRSKLGIRPLALSIVPFFSARPQIFARRGGCDLGPENTIAAFDVGMSTGADGLELDVHLSADGLVVVHHDKTLDRTTNASGPIAARPARELERVDAGYWFKRGEAYPFRGQGIGVPTLRAVLARYRGIPT